ncbi:hypothetical protein FSP39_011866 [Pinctada imbricata]|uniref:G-protein coupled receptors family 1 profile domain-containing protein n=1 Tax=Pinctada imbricata TaxID=66713 RepID=A0AA88YCJ8_PINIB|nr:hypothetical protein FSP39_011866 [Pinctada imbricata]
MNGSSSSGHGSAEDLLDSKHLQEADYAACVAMIAINVTTFFANVTVIIGILSNKRLRNTPTNYLLINLCVIDLISASTILPISIHTFISKGWPWGESLCQILGVLVSFCIFSSILSICSISIERFYSIKLPMHHAAHCSVTKVLLVILIVWIFCSAIASLPVLGWNEYEYLPYRVQCLLSWETEERHQSFIILISCVCFLIPGFVLCFTFLGIYKVAKLSATQVHPTIGNIAPFDSNDSISEPTRHTVVVNPVKTGNFTCNNNNINNNNNLADSVGLRCQNKRLKAAKTLLVLLILYIVLWGPYFTLQIIGVSQNLHSTSYMIAESVTLWIGYVSFAVNPFLYGWINTSIRESLKHLWSRCKQCGKDNETSSVDLYVQTTENFVQFLERTNGCPATLSPQIHI